MSNESDPPNNPDATERYLDLPLGPRGEEHPGDSGDPPRGEPVPPAAAPSPAPPSPVPPRRWPWILALLLGAVALLAVGAWLGRSWWGGPPSLRPSLTLVEFGEQRPGAESPPREVVLSHAGGGALELASVALTGGGAADFRLVADGCTGRRMGAGETCTVLTAFAPGSAHDGAGDGAGDPAAGSRAASLEVVGGFGNSPLEIPLLGTVVTPLLSLDQESLVFPPQPTGVVSPPRTLRLTNRGSAAAEVEAVGLDGSAAEDFRISADFCSRSTLAPEQRCTVEVVFQPATEGPRQARLRLPWTGGAALTVALSGQAEAAALVASPGELDFAVTSVEGSAGPVRVTLTNPAVTPVEIREVTTAGPFRIAEQSCVGSPVPGGGTCTVDVVFEPATEGEVEGELSLLPVMAEPLVLPLVGRAVAPELAFSEARLDFGAVPVGREEERDVALGNRGSGAGTLALALTGPGAEAFSLAGECVELRDGELPPGSTCSLAVTFRPLRAGQVEARVTARVGGGVELALAGRGRVGRAELSARRLDFGSVVVGESARRRLTVTHTGQAPLPLGPARIEGLQAREFTLRDGCRERSRLSPGESCELEVVLRPGGEGRRRARIVWPGGGPGLVPVELEGVGREPRPRPRITPARLGFGTVAVGGRSGIETVTLRNDGQGRLGLQGVRLEGEGAHEYRLVAGTCEGLPFLAPGGSCTMGIRFEPAVPGASRARLVVRHDGPEGASRVDLTGNGQ